MLIEMAGKLTTEIIEEILYIKREAFAINVFTYTLTRVSFIIISTL